MSTVKQALLLVASLCMGLSHAFATEGTIRIITEEFPPYNYTDPATGRITGFSTEVVEAVLAEIGMKGEIQSLPWARAYELVQASEGVLIYSIGRTKERDELFKWVGVIAPTHYYLFSLPERNLTVETLDEARAYQIATVNMDVGEQYLVSHGFAKGVNLQSSVKYELNYEKLRAGRVDLWIISELVAVHLARQAGDDPERTLARSLRIRDLGDDGYYMAFGKKTPDELVERFRAGLEAIRLNGTYDSLKRKWM